MFTRFTLLTFTLGILMPLAAAAAEESTPALSVQVALPSEVPCKKTTGRARASCITDNLKKWKALEYDYDKQEDVVVEIWKTENAGMGVVTAEYQKALRAYLSNLLVERKAFKKKLQIYRQMFFAEQKAKRDEGDGRKATETQKLEKTTLEAAKAVCGEEDDDGAFRLCMRLQLRKKPTGVDKRSQSSTKLLP